MKNKIASDLSITTHKANSYLAQKSLLMIANGLLFQLGWFSAVLGGDSIALIATLLILLMHQLFFVANNREWLLISGVAFIGFSVDSVLSIAGVLIFSSQVGIPLWLLCIWVLFACTINHSLSWLKDKPLLAILMGAIAGPSSYFAGSKLSDVSFAEPLTTSLAIMITVWAVLLPSLIMLAKKINSGHTDE